MPRRRSAKASRLAEPELTCETNHPSTALPAPTSPLLIYPAQKTLGGKRRLGLPMSETRDISDTSNGRCRLVVLCLAQPLSPRPSRRPRLDVRCGVEKWPKWSEIPASEWGRGVQAIIIPSARIPRAAVRAAARRLVVATFSMAISIAMHNKRIHPDWVRAHHCMTALLGTCDRSQSLNASLS
jgi:hypothetical protein